MANSITGVVLAIKDTESVAGKDPARPFTKRKIMLDCTRRDPYTGERSEFENHPVLEFTGDKVAELDKCHVGDVVDVMFTVEGRTYTDKTGQPRNFTGIRAYGLVVRKTTQPQAQPQPQQVQPFMNNSDVPF